MKNWILVLSLGLNLLLAGSLLWVNERYGLWGKLQRVALEEGRVPGMAARHELNRNYQARREMFRLDRNKDAKILFIGDSQVSLADWNAMLGAPLVANRGIEGDTTAGVLARLDDDQDFVGNTVVLWIGTNDVLQGEEAGGIASRIVDAVRRLGVRSRAERTEDSSKANRLERNDSRAAGSPGGEIKLEIEDREGTVGDGSLEIADGGEQGGKAESGNAETRKGTANRKVMVLSVAPVAEWVARAAERNLVVAEVNERLAAAAPANGFAFVDLDPVVSDGRGYLRGDMTSDGVHLNAAAYREIVGKVEEEIGGRR